MALRSITRDCKSLVLALALLKRQITVQEAIDASRVEEESQVGAYFATHSNIQTFSFRRSKPGV